MILSYNDFINESLLTKLKSKVSSIISKFDSPSALSKETDFNLSLFNELSRSIIYDTSVQIFNSKWRQLKAYVFEHNKKEFESIISSSSFKISTAATIASVATKFYDAIVDTINNSLSKVFPNNKNFEEISNYFSTFIIPTILPIEFDTTFGPFIKSKKFDGDNKLYSKFISNIKGSN